MRWIERGTIWASCMLRVRSGRPRQLPARKSKQRHPTGSKTTVEQQVTSCIAYLCKRDPYTGEVTRPITPLIARCELHNVFFSRVTDDCPSNPPVARHIARPLDIYALCTTSKDRWGIPALSRFGSRGNRHLGRRDRPLVASNFAVGALDGWLSRRRLRCNRREWSERVLAAADGHQRRVLVDAVDSDARRRARARPHRRLHRAERGRLFP